MAYVPNVYETTRPVDADIAETAQLEFRTIKAFYQGIMARSGGVTLVNSVGPATAFLTSVPAGSLGTNKRLRLTIFGTCVNATGGAVSGANFIASYGGNGLWTGTLPVNMAANGTFAFKLEIILANVSAVAQVMFMEFQVYNAPSGIGLVAAGLAFTGTENTLAVNSAIAQNLLVQFSNSVASPNLATVIDSAICEWG